MIIGSEILKEDEEPRYRVTWAAESHAVNFEVFEIQSYSFEGEILTEESACTARIKWDGCSDWQQTNGYQHFCGVLGLSRLCSVQVWLYAKAAELLQEAGYSFRDEDMSDFFP